MQNEASPESSKVMPSFVSGEFYELPANKPLQASRPTNKGKALKTFRDDILRDDPLSRMLTLAANYHVTAGVLYPEAEQHEFYDFDDSADEPAPHPTVTSYYGHEILCPSGIEIFELRRTKKFRIVIVTFIRLTPGRTFKMLAWQGDNDTIHLMEPFEHEDEYLGVYPAIIFGKKTRADDVRSENREYYLRQVVHGSSAVLDSDVTLLETEFPDSMVSSTPAVQA